MKNNHLIHQPDRFGVAKRVNSDTLISTLNKSRLTVSALCIVFAISVSATLEISQALINKLQSKYGHSAVQRVLKWQKFLQTAKNLPEAEKLLLVNDFFNQQIQFVDDTELWGLSDYWATPLEFLAQGAGDCEDYSIAKYFTLKELGVPENKMRLTYVKAIKLNQAHMVLTYFSSPDSVPVVLDNLVPVIKSATQRQDLVPVYSFNGMGLWVAKKQGHSRLVGNSKRLDLWAQLKQRMLEKPF